MTRITMLLAAILSACGGAAPAQPQPTTPMMPPTLSIGIPNERHLGHIVTGGPPDAAALERALEVGVTTVITLRLELEAGFEAERTKVEELGMRFVSIPVDGAAGVTEANARLVDEAIMDANGDVLLHCGSGNRAGAMLALRAFYVRGKTLDESMQIGLAAGLTDLQEAVRANIEVTCSADEAPPQCTGR